ncbi:hypothetical protein B0J18DRAFT_280738 [Chaetomium sp. MPI-SDFR-AT-0129]|nr:hypothetical protein B0J18DRAFT_280738 [Chaetomium sp. MPI-SDFR-AT-0129]
MAFMQIPSENGRSVCWRGWWLYLSLRLARSAIARCCSGCFQHHQQQPKLKIYHGISEGKAGRRARDRQLTNCRLDRCLFLYALDAWPRPNGLIVTQRLGNTALQCGPELLT